MTASAKDLAAGLFFVSVGLFFAIDSAMYLTVGTAFRMGPGYFPIVLGGLLAILGGGILLRGLRSRLPDPIGGISVRGVLLTALAPILFGATVQGLGLIAAIFLSTFVSALSSRKVGFRFAAVLTVGLTAFCIAVFHYGLGLPMRLVGPWLGNWDL